MNINANPTLEATGAPAQDRGAAGSGCLAAALKYAARGWPVFPIWPITNGKCACGEADCEHPGKHPLGKLAPNGRNSATTDPAMIRGWCGICPDANIGIATGPESSLVVVDVDPRNGGDKSFKNLPGIMPLTITAQTGGGGEHYYFKHPGKGQKIKSKSGLGGFSGIDQKADGGYIVAPQSNHISGDMYSWKIPPSDTYPLAPIPDWLMALLIMGDEEPRRQYKGNAGDAIPEGKRNETLASLAGTMRKRGMTQEAIEAALLVENKRCDPPLSDKEVLTIASSVSRYAPGGQGGAIGGAWPEPAPLEDKGLGSVTPMLVNPLLGLSVTSPEPSQQVRLYQTPRLPTIRAGMIRERCQERGQGSKSGGWRNGPNGEAEQALMPTQIPHSGYPWVIPDCHKIKNG